MLIRKRLSRVGLGGAGERDGAPGVTLAAREGVRVCARLPDPAMVAADAALVADVVAVHDPLVVVAVVNVVVAVDIAWSWGVVHHSILVVHHHSETNIYHPILSCNSDMALAWGWWPCPCWRSAPSPSARSRPSGCCTPGWWTAGTRAGASS